MSFLLNQMSFVVSDSKLACGEPLQRHCRTLFIVRRYHEPRQRSCLFIGICDRNRDQGCCKHASVCLAVTHGHHVGTLEPKIVDQPAKCRTLADTCVHDINEVPVSLDHIRPGSQAFHDEVPDSIRVLRQAYDGDFPHSICCNLACHWNTAQVTGIPAGGPLVDKAEGAHVAKRLQIAPTIQDHVHRNVCLLYTSDAADDLLCVDLGGRRIIKKKKKKNK